MQTMLSTLAAFSLASVLALSAPARIPSRIDDPKAFVTEVYRQFTAAESIHSSYRPPEDIYTPRLQKLIREDKRKAKGEVGCVDFVFWVNGQDWKITQLTITSADQRPEAKTVAAKFRNLGEPEELHFDFRRTAGHWLLDEVHSVTSPPWTLSELLKCTP